MTGRWSAGGDHAMTTDITSPAAEAAETALFLGEDWFDPLEAGVRTRIRSFIEDLLEAELEAALGRKRYARGRTPETEPSTEAARSPVSSHRHGHRERAQPGCVGALRGPASAWQADLDRVRGERGQRDRGQAHDQGAVGALDQSDGATLPRRAHSRAEQHARGRLPSTLSGLPARE